MARPRVPEDERCEAEFRLRLNEEDALLVRLLARKAGIAPAAYLRAIVRSRLQAAPTFSSEKVKQEKSA